MWLYLTSDGHVQGIVSDRFVLRYTTGGRIVAFDEDPDIYVWSLIAIFQPLTDEWQQPLW